MMDDMRNLMALSTCRDAESDSGHPERPDFHMGSRGTSSRMEAS